MSHGSVQSGTARVRESPAFLSRDGSNRCRATARVPHSNHWRDRTNSHRVVPRACARAAVLSRPIRSKAEQFDLNLADTMQLEALPGIGEKLSRRIIKYRSSLGGFVDVVLSSGEDYDTPTKIVGFDRGQILASCAPFRITTVATGDLNRDGRVVPPIRYPS